MMTEELSIFGSRDPTFAKVHSPIRQNSVLFMLYWVAKIISAEERKWVSFNYSLYMTYH